MRWEASMRHKCPWVCCTNEINCFMTYNCPPCRPPSQGWATPTLAHQFHKVFGHAKLNVFLLSSSLPGILAQRWQILRKPILGDPKNIEMMVGACTVLHNYLLINNDRTYLPGGSADAIFGEGEGAQGQWRAAGEGLQQAPGTNVRNYTMVASETREEFRDYFMAEGAVAWQYDHVKRRVNRL